MLRSLDAGNAFRSLVWPALSVTTLPYRLRVARGSLLQMRRGAGTDARESPFTPTLEVPMSRIKALALVVLSLGGITAFTPNSTAPPSQPAAMCARFYCFFNGQCNYAPTCWSNGCKNCL